MNPPPADLPPTLSPVANSMRLAAFLALLSVAAGCALLPASPPVTEASLSQAQARTAFQEDQQRRARIAYWIVDGVLRVQEQEVTRALRVALKGNGAQSARMRVFGPFQKLEVEVLTQGARLEMVHPGRREVWRVPSTAEAMGRMVGVPFPPGALMEILLGVSEAPGVIQEAPLDKSGDPREGAARIAGADGRLLERRTWLDGVGAVHITYGWSGEEAVSPAGLPMPKEVRVEIEAPGTFSPTSTLRGVEMALKGWRFPADDEGDPLRARAVPPGFELLERL